MRGEVVMNSETTGLKREMEVLGSGRADKG